MSALIYNPPDLANPTLFDAFGRQRVSSPETVFDSKLIFDAAPLLWNESNTNGAAAGVWSQADARVRLTAAGGTQSSIRQTKTYFPYQPGKSQLIFVTFNLNGAVAATTKEVGLNDASNGVLLQTSGTTVNLVLRSGSSTASVTVAQASWNIDTLLGTGPSRITLDLTKTQILALDFEWLGVGTVRVGFVIGGKIVYVHAFQNANVSTAVYMSTPNLPVRYSIVSSGGTSTLDCICATVISEGGAKANGLNFGYVRTAATGNIAAAAVAPVVSLRLNATYNRVPVVPLAMSLLATGNNNTAWELHLNPTLTGATFAAQAGSPTTGYCDVDTAATAVSVAGTVLATGLLSGVTRSEANALLTTYLRIGSTIAGVSDILSLVITNLSAGNETYRGSLDWLALV